MPSRPTVFIIVMEQGELGEGRDEKGLLFLSGFFHIFGRFLYPRKNIYILRVELEEVGDGVGAGPASGAGTAAGSLEGHCGPPRLY